MLQSLWVCKMIKLNNIIDLFVKFADDDYEHRHPKLRDPNQLHFKFIDPKDVEIIKKDIKEITVEEADQFLNEKLFVAPGSSLHGVYHTIQSGNVDQYVKYDVEKTFFIAKYKSKIVGILLVSDYGGSRDALCDTYTIPEFRDNGIGRLLINEAKKYYKKLTFGCSEYFYEPTIENKKSEDFELFKNRQDIRKKSDEEDIKASINYCLRLGLSLDDLDDDGHIVDFRLKNIILKNDKLRNTSDKFEKLKQEIREYKEKNYPQRPLPNISI